MQPKLVHIELPAKDTTRARTCLGPARRLGVPGLGRAAPSTGCSRASPAARSTRPMLRSTGPLVYFGSDDIDADIAAVRELGGRAEDRQPIPGVGWFARCEDTEGNHFSLFQSDESVPAG